MKSLVLMCAMLVLGLTLAVDDAEAARRLGGGKSFGMQREAPVTRKTPDATPAPNQAATPMAARQPGAAAAPQAQPKRSWMGPLAGLAAGLGLAALASHFGFGEELASMLMIGLMVLAVLAVVGMIMRRRAAAQQPAMAGARGMQYAGAGAGADAGRAGYAGRESSPMPVEIGSAVPASPVAGAAATSTGQAGNVPADFDAEGFVRHAKVSFIRLQAANDAGNLADIREFTTPEMFAEIRMNITERGSAQQQTDVVKLDAEVIDVAQEAERYVVSVRFSGLLREGDDAAPAPVDELWHMVKPRDGSHGWVLAGIQQVQ
ncbi:MAG: Tim44 domain-containing protein [Betaproteobacteria bacterium]|nr:Tim44 domain-containing protein [Betaproteobacteria bacterium]